MGEMLGSLSEHCFKEGQRQMRSRQNLELLLLNRAISSGRRRSWNLPTWRAMGSYRIFLESPKNGFFLEKRIRTQPWLQRRQNKVMMPNSFGQYATSNRETYLLFAYCSVPTDSGAACWLVWRLTLGSPGALSPSESTTDLVPQFCLDIVEFSF